VQTVRPESVGLSSDRLKRIDDHFARRYVDQGKLAGALTLVARRGEIAHLGLVGQADKERGVPMRADTLFRIYSMTKPLTTALFMMLVEEGKVELTDPVHALIPSWKNLQVFTGGTPGHFQTRPTERPMLVIDLLRHTSGLTYSFQNRTPIDQAYREGRVGVLDGEPLDLQQTIDALADLPLEFSPGTAWNYSVSTDVLGYLIQVIEGRPFEQVMRERLLTPLGLVDTDFQSRPDNAERLAACYMAPRGQFALQDDPKTSPFNAAPKLVSGGGGLVSTAADYLRFCRMMLAGGTLDGVRYLSPKSVALMTSNHLPGQVDLPALSVSMFSEVGYAGVGFGLGFAVVTNPAATLLPGTAGDYSWGGAASTYFWVDPAEDLIVILMTQFMPSSLYPIRRELRTLVYSAFEESWA
jgi:CubicO group peptidase (beta-lactamase class C family)